MKQREWSKDLLLPAEKYYYDDSKSSSTFELFFRVRFFSFWDHYNAVLRKNEDMSIQYVCVCVYVNAFEVIGRVNDLHLYIVTWNGNVIIIFFFYELNAISSDEIFIKIRSTD